MCKAAAVLSVCKNMEVRKSFGSLVKAVDFFFRRFVHRYTQKNVLNNHRGRGFSAVIAGASKSLRLIVSWALSGHSCCPLFPSSSSYCVLWLQLPSYENRFVYGFFLIFETGAHDAVQVSLELTILPSQPVQVSAATPGLLTSVEVFHTRTLGFYWKILSIFL